MLREVYGRIESAEFGIHPEYQRLIGLMIVLRYGERGFVKDNRRMIQKIKNNTEEYETLMNEVLTLLKEADVHKVSDLKGTPVEIVFYDDRYMGFKIHKNS